MDVLIQDIFNFCGKKQNIFISEGRIHKICESGILKPGKAWQVIDGSGFMALPGLVDAHAHLDKTVWGMEWIPNVGYPELSQIITHERKDRQRYGIDPFTQACRHIELSMSMGVMYMRSHVDIDTENGLAGAEGLLKAREKYKGQFYLELVAFPQSGVLKCPGTLSLMEEALKMGVDIVGGLDPAAIDRDPAGCLNELFHLAEKYDRPLDIHLHEPGTLGGFTMELIAERTKALGMGGRVTISHAFCLGYPDESFVNSLMCKLADAGISVATSAQPFIPTIPSAKKLYEAGVNVCGGNDNVCDLWSHYGSGDMIERAQLIAMRNGFQSDNDLAFAMEMCTENGAKLLGLEGYGLKEGNIADMVLVKARNVAECVAMVPKDRKVIRKGRLEQ